MPLRRDPALWFNMPGAVAAYQPVAAPGPLLARYNQAHGGSNLYKAADGVAPTFSPLTGWSLDGTQYLTAAWTPNQRPLTYIARIKPSGTSGYRTIIGGLSSDGAYSWDLTTGTNVPRLVRQNTALIANATSGFAGGADTVIAVTYSATGAYAHYLNGAANGSGTNNVAAGAADVANIGAQRGGVLQQPYSGAILVVAVCTVVLSPAHIAQYSRQMAYCHVNPDWSAWGRRRRYYYAPIEPPVTTADDIRLAAAGVGAFGPRLGGAARMGYQQAAELPAAARAGHRSRLNG